MRHPNAAVAGATTGSAVLVIWALGLVGVGVDGVVGAAIAGALATAALFVGRKGIRGIMSIVWRGESP